MEYHFRVQQLLEILKIKTKEYSVNQSQLYGSVDLNDYYRYFFCVFFLILMLFLALLW